ncbi:hypothetical protein BGZ79_008086 [Entomortierella chlamydospora]|nr:hypothetical protein BGZ79_008086 [Entomortierella chlamydospora]
MDQPTLLELTTQSSQQPQPSQLHQHQQQTQPQSQNIIEQEEDNIENDENNYSDETEIIVVRALYPFRSEDSTSLSFQKDELIQVLTQLESGWWYGYCHGERGWFPSNYVEIIAQEDYDSVSEEISEDEMASDDLWLPQTTVDGQVFYFNTRTGDSSWTIPSQSPRSKEVSVAIEEESVADNINKKRQDDTDSDNIIRHNDTTITLSDSTPSNAHKNLSKEPFEEQAQRTNSITSRTTVGPTHDYTDTESQGGSTRRSSWQTSAIPTRAGSPVQGPITTLAGHRRPSVATPLDTASSQSLPPLPSLSNPFDPEPTWESLADHTTGALQNLLHSAEKGYKAYYQIQASQVVEAIRVMLYASGTVDKESEPIRMHRGLRVHHRQIMSALSKLVLSAKMASSFWPAEGAVSKMLADANDVAQAVHQFIFAAQSAGVHVHDVDAKLVLDPESPVESKPAQRLSRTFSTASTRVSSETSSQNPYRTSALSVNLVNQLDYYAKSSCKALGVLSLQVKKAIETSLNPAQPAPTSRLSLGSSILNSAQSSQLVNQCHQTISQLGSLLNLVGEFYTQTLDQFPDIQDHIYIDVRSSKQTLYNNVAALVMAIQLATDPMVQTSVLEMALEATTTAEKSTLSLVAFTRTLAEERDRLEKLAQPDNKMDSNLTLVAQPAFSEQHRQNDIDMYFGEQESDMDGENAKNSRNRSDSQLSSFSSASSTSNASAPTTPGTEYTVRSQQGSYFPPMPIDRPLSPSPLPTTPTSSTAQGPKHDARGDKLRKMLGADAPAPKPKAVEQPWYLGQDYLPSDISFNMEGHVRGGTLPALVERLTLHDGLDPNFVLTFLLTYRSFATTDELFTLLFRRFTISPPQGLEAHEHEEWVEKKLTPVRLRVFNIIKSWLENYYLEDEVEDRQILPRIKEFSESSLMRDAMSFAAVQLIKLVERRETSDGSLRKMVLNMTTQAPQPIIPRNLKKIRFMDLDPLELARQLTIMEAGYYNKIKPIECLAKAWISEDPELAAKAVNIKKMIETSNLYSNWINEIVLGEKETKKRAAIIKHLVALAERLRQLNNFSMLSATTAALSQSPIHRLKRTWELVPNKTMSSLATLQQVTSSAKNWADYRAELHSVNPPCVPFVGVYLTDLVMIQDGNPDFLRRTDNHINFYKRVGTAEVIREIQQYQSVPYCLTPVPEIQTFIRKGMDQARSVAELYDMSLELEPRVAFRGQSAVSNGNMPSMAINRLPGSIFGGKKRLYSSGIPSSNSASNTVSTATTTTAAATTTTAAATTTTAATVGIKSGAGPKQSKFRQYAEQFKNKPASHLISFGILHEVTAVVPLPIIYFALIETGVEIPFPEQAMEEGNRFVARVAKYYGWNLEGSDGARVMLNMATSYAVVKALLPLRLALCVWMTPWTATRIVSPIMNFWRRFKK